MKLLGIIFAINILILTTNSLPWECPSLDELGDCYCIKNSRMLFCGPDTKLFPQLAEVNLFDIITLDGIDNHDNIYLRNLRANSFIMKNMNVKNFEFITSDLTSTISELSIDTIYKDDKIPIDIVTLFTKININQLTKLEIINSNLDAIPDLNNFVKLNSLTLSKNKITKIEAGRFQAIKTLTTVNLDNNMIMNIDANALEFDTDGPLNLNFAYNIITVDMLLTGKTIINNKENSILVDLRDNNITTLPANPFASYDNDKSKIKMLLDHNRFKCTWTENSWIFNMEHLKTAMKHFIHVNCANYQNRDLFLIDPSEYPDKPTPTPPTTPYTGTYTASTLQQTTRLPTTTNPSPWSTS